RGAGGIQGAGIAVVAAAAACLGGARHGAATRSGTIARAVIALLARIDAAVPTDVVDDRAGNCLFKAGVGAAARCDAGAEVDNAGERIRNGEADPGAFVPLGAEGTPPRTGQTV